MNINRQIAHTLKAAGAVWPLLLLLSGIVDLFGIHEEHWEQTEVLLTAPQIAALSPEIAVTVAPVTGGDRIEEIASGLLDVLPRKFALAGLSMGGIVAMEILRRAPERVSRLALMDTNALAAGDDPAPVGLAGVEPGDHAGFRARHHRRRRGRLRRGPRLPCRAPVCP